MLINQEKTKELIPDNYFEIKDWCRRNLIRYTLKAFSTIPEIDRPLILDLGCGTGESTLALLGVCDGYVYAVDSDEKSLACLENKADLLNLSNRIKIIHDTALNTDLFDLRFDLIIAEGILNVIGFGKGLEIIIKLLKNDGYAIIHDELRDDEEKRITFERNALKVLTKFELDEAIWWNDYYASLEESIKSVGNPDLFQNEIQEINEYKSNPEKFRSIIYVLEKTSGQR